jgi:hypothetical protein
VEGASTVQGAVSVCSPDINTQNGTEKNGFAYMNTVRMLPLPKYKNQRWTKKRYNNGMIWL